MLRGLRLARRELRGGVRIGEGAQPQSRLLQPPHLPPQRRPHRRSAVALVRRGEGAVGRRL